MSRLNVHQNNRIYFFITDLYRQPICIQPSLSANRTTTGPNQRLPTYFGTPQKCPNPRNCLPILRPTAEVLRQKPIRQMKIHLSRIINFLHLDFFCFLLKIYWPSILVHFDWKTSLISAIIRMTHKKSSETTDGCHVSAIEKNLKKDTMYQTFILCPKIAKNSNLLSSKKKVEMVACYHCNVKCAWSRVSNFESTFLHFASSPNK